MQCFLNQAIRKRGVKKCQVIANRGIEQMDILGDNGNRLSERIQLKCLDILVSEVDRSTIRPIKTQEQIGNRRFSTPSSTEYAEPMTCWQSEGQIVENWNTWRIAKCNMPETHLNGSFQVKKFRTLKHLGWCLQNLLYSLTASTNIVQIVELLRDCVNWANQHSCVIVDKIDCAE